jgi:hypothetical protein
MLYCEIIAVCSEIHTNTLCEQNVEFLGVLTKLRKATISLEQLGSHWTDFDET